ncbi:MAG: hypothetical protein M5U16_04910 [Hyphomicrobium sp.]|nr:hypothetical protein [Hyphomicrobium sp.]
MDDDEPLLGELQPVVGLEPIRVTALQALPGAELADVIGSASNVLSAKITWIRNVVLCRHMLHDVGDARGKVADFLAVLGEHLSMARDVVERSLFCQEGIVRADRKRATSGEWGRRGPACG